VAASADCCFVRGMQERQEHQPRLPRPFPSSGVGGAPRCRETPAIRAKRDH
jgi:hypothetical protein